MSDQLKFYKGIEKDLPLPESLTDNNIGSLYYCMDTNNTYLVVKKPLTLYVSSDDLKYESISLSYSFNNKVSNKTLVPNTYYEVGLISKSHYLAITNSTYVSLNMSYKDRDPKSIGLNDVSPNTYYYFNTNNIYIASDKPGYELYSSAIGYRTPNQGIVIGEGEANASYALAGGSTDISIATGLLGFDPTSYLSPEEQQLFINKSIADAPMSTSYGTTNITKTPGSLAMGLKNQSGILGYYVRAISSDGLILTLSREQSEDVTPDSSLLNQWVNTYISFSDGEDFYSLYGKVSAVSGNKITIDGSTVQSPITELKDIDKTNVGSRMIYAIPETMVKSIEIFGVNLGEVEMCRPNSVGEVKFGYVTNAFGFDNIAASNLSTAFGMRNNAIGATAFVTGRENTGSFASLVGGHKNTVTGGAGFATGFNNIVHGQRGAAIGANNITNGKYAFSAGLNNKAETQCSVVFGTGNTSDVNYQLITGRYSQLDEDKEYLFIVGNGTSDTNRSNAFTVDKSGNVSITKTLTINGTTTANGTMDARNIVPQTSNTYYLGTSNNYWKGIAATTISVSSAIVPFEHETGSIGIEAKCWKNLYVKGLSVKNGNTSIQHLYPNTTNTYTLGQSDYRWNKIYGNGVSIVDGNIIPVKPFINGAESTSVGTLGNEQSPWNTLYVNDTLIDNTLEVNGFASFMSSIDVFGPVYMDNSLTVADPASFSSSVTMNGDIIISPEAYGNEAELPQTGHIGQIFFVKVE